MEQILEVPVKPEKYQHVLIRIVAIIQTVYALIEITDSITAALMSTGLVNNPYPAMASSEMQSIFDKDPIWLVPLFLFYTSMRAASAIGLWKNRMWGFWLTIAVSFATLMMAPFLFPFTSAEMLLDGIVIILVLIGYLGNRRIFTSE
jgi:uncharacterized membrane protein (DUF2068 family)